MLLLYILWDDWPISMISRSNEQLLQEFEYTLIKSDCHSWWISKMQSERVDTLEEQYTIKICFRLGKNAKETYRMLQTAFWPSSMNQFLSGIRDSRKAGSLWGMMRGVGGVGKSELIGQIKNFMDKDGAQFDVRVGTVHTIIREMLKMQKICAKFVPRVLKEVQKERRCHEST